MNLRIAYCLFLLCLCFSSCKKQDTIPPCHNTYVTLDSAMTSDRFLSGTYWIYRNDSSGLLDTISVISTQHANTTAIPGGTASQTGGCSTIHESYDMHIFSTARNKNEVYRLVGNRLCYPAYSAPDDRPTGQAIYYASPWTKTLGLEYVGTLDSLNCNNTWYFNVTEAKVIAAEQYLNVYDYDTWFCYLPGTGILQKRMETSPGVFESWTLLSCNLIH